jgi:excinuclease ABC subunit A
MIITKTPLAEIVPVENAMMLNWMVIQWDKDDLVDMGLVKIDLLGLGYVKLGQSATTLSGGEAQRVKISSELYRAHLQKTIYLLDEPTVGLHYEDVKKLIDILQKLVNKGNTVVVIEHNLDLVKNADYVIDIGPEGGERGGKIVAKGTPEDIANSDKSYTGKYLKKMLGKK